MNLINQNVKHKVYGKGVVTEIGDGYIKIQFALKESKKFTYPDSFNDYLVAEDMTVQAIIVQEIEVNKQAQREEQLARENARRQEAEQHDLQIQLTPCRNFEKLFRSDYHVQFLSRSPILSYKQVEEQFNIRISGFGRGINITANSIVLISSIGVKRSFFVYHDHWTTDGDYIYSGEGRSGNQQLTKGNNAIINAKNDRKTIYLFVKFSPQEYYFQGEFNLVDYTYEDDKDENGNLRKEYKFRLRKCSIV